MIRRKTDCTGQVFEHRFDGDGYITVENLIGSNDDLNNKGRAFTHTTLLPGHSIGFHTHTDESEIYYILKGKALFNDNGTETEVSAGDITFTFSGSGHAIRNISEDETLEFVGLILFA